MEANRSLDPATRLRKAREEKGLSHRQVADATKLSVRTIEALEGNRVSALPGGIYRRAIIRAVASEVGLNSEQLLREFTQVHPDLLAVQAASPEVAAPQQPSPSRQKALTFVSAMVPLLAGVTYFGWPSPQTMNVPTVVEAAPISGTLRPEIVPAGGFTDTPVALPRAVVVTLTISSRCQLRIVADGHEVLGRAVEQGENISIELGDELVLLGDNASAVQFSINGQAGRLLGDPGDLLSVRIGRDDYEDFLARY